MRLSVLDQTPVPAGTSVSEALANTVHLAQVAENLGYSRYWLAEHHGSGGLAGSAPEVLIAHVAANTSTIRVGSGGVMLSHYSPLKVAEQFRLLENLHPGRIDLGLGRAPGSEPITAFALQRNRQHPAGDDFNDQLAELIAWLSDAFPGEHPFARLSASPVPGGAPDLWLLSSSGFSAKVAAHFGTGLCFAHFINTDGGADAIAEYVKLFEPARPGDVPRTAVAVGAICADTDDAARELARSNLLWRVRRQRGLNGPIPSLEEALAHPWSAADEMIADTFRQRLFIGSPTSVHDRIEALAASFGVEEVFVLTIAHSHAARVHSYELLAGAFGLKPRSELPIYS